MDATVVISIAAARPSRVSHHWPTSIENSSPPTRKSSFSYAYRLSYWLRLASKDLSMSTHGQEVMGWPFAFVEVRPPVYYDACNVLHYPTARLMDFTAVSDSLLSSPSGNPRVKYVQALGKTWLYHLLNEALTIKVQLKYTAGRKALQGIAALRS